MTEHHYHFAQRRSSANSPSVARVAREAPVVPQRVHGLRAGMSLVVPPVRPGFVGDPFPSGPN